MSGEPEEYNPEGPARSYYPQQSEGPSSEYLERSTAPHIPEDVADHFLHQIWSSRDFTLGFWDKKTFEEMKASASIFEILNALGHPPTQSLFRQSPDGFTKITSLHSQIMASLTPWMISRFTRSLEGNERKQLAMSTQVRVAEGVPQQRGAIANAFAKVFGGSKR